MDKFLPDTDNFFKYLLTIGLILIVFVIIYPVQEQKEVDIEINGYQKDAKVLDYRVARLKADILEFDSVTTKSQGILDSLKKVESAQNGMQRSETELTRNRIKDEFDVKRGRLIELTDSLAIIDITNQAERQKIQKLEGYFAFFKTYKIVFLIAGVVIAAFGLYYWSASVYRDEKKKDQELQNHMSAYVTHVKVVKSRLKNRILAGVVILLAILVVCFIIWCASYS